MSATGLEVFDRTLQTTNAWLNEIGQTVGPDKQRAYHALRAVLFALRDRMPIEEAAHLSAQLPLLVRGIYWEAYRPTGKPEKLRSKDEFLQKVATEFATAQPMDPEACVRAVFGVLERHIPDGEMSDIRQMMPEAVRAMFPSVGSGRPAA